jgi:hypothetical protein
VAVFDNFDTGKSLETFFAGHGLEARTYDDKLFRYFLFLRPPKVTYHVQVKKERFEDANRLMAAVASAILTKAIHCPSCNSLRINYPQMTRRFVLPTILLHLGIIFRVIEHQCYCEHCHHMWTLLGEASALHKARDAKPFPF